MFVCMYVCVRVHMYMCTNEAPSNTPTVVLQCKAIEGRPKWLADTYVFPALECQGLPLGTGESSVVVTSSPVVLVMSKHSRTSYHIVWEL